MFFFLSSVYSVCCEIRSFFAGHFREDWVLCPRAAHLSGLGRTSRYFFHQERVFLLCVLASVVTCVLESSMSTCQSVWSGGNFLPRNTDSNNKRKLIISNYYLTACTPTASDLSQSLLVTLLGHSFSLRVFKSSILWMCAERCVFFSEW